MAYEDRRIDEFEIEDGIKFMEILMEGAKIVGCRYR